MFSFFPFPPHFIFFFIHWLDISSLILLKRVTLISIIWFSLLLSIILFSWRSLGLFSSSFCILLMLILFLLFFLIYLFVYLLLFWEGNSFLLWFRICPLQFVSFSSFFSLFSVFYHIPRVCLMLCGICFSSCNFMLTSQIVPPLLILFLMFFAIFSIF